MVLKGLLSFLLIWLLALNSNVACKSSTSVDEQVIYPHSLLSTDVYEGNYASYATLDFGRNEDFWGTVLKANGIYEISEVYDLKGKEIEIPNNCTLVFNGGLLKNGTIKGAETFIDANFAQIFYNIKLTGSWKNKEFFSYWFGVKGDGKKDDSRSLNYAIKVIPKESTLKHFGDKILIKEEILINRNINLDFEVETILKNNGRFTFDGVKDCRYRIKKIRGEGRRSNNIALNLINCCFCQFDVDVIDSCLYGISFNKENRTYDMASLGQNIFRFVRINNCNKGIVFWGDKAWISDKVLWAEGNEFRGGFIVKCDTGIEMQDNIKCGDIIFMGAIDCVEIPNSFDIIDKTNSRVYAQKNIFILNYFRVNASILRKYDTFVSTDYGIQSYGRGIYHDGIYIGHDDDKVMLLPGRIEISSPNGSFIDMKTNEKEDRDARIFVDDSSMTLSKKEGSSLSISDVIRIKDSGTIKIPAGEKGPFYVELSIPKNSSDYIVLLTPTWETISYVINKKRIGFSVCVSIAPREDKDVYWLVLGNN